MSDARVSSSSVDRSVTLWLEQRQAGHTVRQIAHGRLDGDSNAELAAQLQLSLRVVVRKLQLIRRQLSQELES